MSIPPVAPSVAPAQGETSRRAVLVAVAGILLLEVALFSWSFGQFFCGDSLYYLWNRVETPAQVMQVLTRPDDLHTYRPLPFIIFSYLLFPPFGLNPLGYHFVSLGVHLLVSLLVFRLLRELVSTPAAALAGTLFFGIHAVNFYITYDVSFLPDFSHGLFCVAALLAYALYRRSGQLAWLSAGLVSFVLALLSKESSVVLPLGVAVIDLLMRTSGCHPDEPGPERPWWRLRPAVIAFVAVAVLYLGWTWYVKGGVYPGGSGKEPYALTLDPARLVLKLRYFAWFANLPTQLERQGWAGYAAIVAMLPALGWILWVGARAAARVWRQLVCCALWALAGLLPVLFISQVPMKHNLYLPVLACAIGLALLVDATEAEAARLLPRGWVWLAAGMVATTAFQVRADLKTSWVGEASHIAQASLEAMKAEHPALPRGALLYVLPTASKGNPSWYFQNGALFNLFYDDGSLRMRFAEQGAGLPADFVSRPDVFIFHFHDFRLWDVTRQYKRDAQDRQSHWLLNDIARARDDSVLPWQQWALLDGKSVSAVRLIGRNGRSRRALVELPGSRVYFPLPPILPDSVLQVGATLAGPLKSFSRGWLFFQDARGTEPLASLTLDAAEDGGHWWDWEIDLSPLAGRQGTLVLETERDQDDDWMAWSRVQIMQRTNPFFGETSQDIDRPLAPRQLRLLDRFEDAEVSFDRREVYPNYDRFDTPTGKPAFLFPARAARYGAPGHATLVTIAGASIRFPIEPVPPASALELAVTDLGKLGDGVRGHVFVEDGARRERVFEELLPAGAKRWVNRTISLEKWGGKPVKLVFEASSGPHHETIGDWCGWARLRIVQKQ